MVYMLIASILITSDSAKEKPPTDDPFLGTWVITQIEEVGLLNQRIDTFGKKGDQISITKEKMIYATAGGVRQEIAYKLDRSKKPWSIDLKFNGKDEPNVTLLGICELKGDSGKLCIDTLHQSKERPDSFSLDNATFRLLICFKRK